MDMNVNEPGNYSTPEGLDYLSSFGRRDAIFPSNCFYLFARYQKSRRRRRSCATDYISIIDKYHLPSLPISVVLGLRT